MVDEAVVCARELQGMTICLSNSMQQREQQANQIASQHLLRALDLEAENSTLLSAVSDLKVYSESSVLPSN